MRRFAVLLVMVGLFIVSCDDGDSENNNVSTCGDNFRDINEECDGIDLGNQTCQNLGYYGGTLSCDNTCHFNTTSCASAGYCGDNLINGEEECDGVELNKKDCAFFGYLNGGTLKCNDTCHFDTSECAGEGTCGNGVVDGDDEECDGSDFSGQTCITMGYYGGTLHCNSLCQIDNSECIAAGKCGDGIIHEAYNEQCDSDNLNGKTCIMLGYNGGNLACDSSCHFDVTSCEGTGTCNDGTIQSDYEECDGNLLGNETCTTLGYYGGLLSCTDTCQYDLDDCRDAGKCGDGVIQSDHEDCDINNLNNQTCEILGYYGGSLSCNADCSFNISNCQSAGKCGDGILQSSHEECDGSELNGTTCSTLGYYGGSLSCNTNCNFNISDCERCGDGILQSSHEECDGSELNGTTCSTLGYYGGSLSCNTNCNFNISDCQSYGKCGDGILQSNHEECDGTDFETSDCSELNYQPDPLTSCLSDCTIDKSVCKIKWNLISASGITTCAIKTDGSLYCWGWNNYGQLGLGDTTDRHSPVRVGSDSNWNLISTSGGHTCAIKTGGSLYCWGWNNHGQLGLGDTTDRHSPVRVGSDSDWNSISTSGHTCAIKTDGSLYCWGGNDYGQLGINNYTDKNTPTQVGSDSDWRSVSTGDTHTCAIKTDGSLYCWGGNIHGQLGIAGEYADYTLPYHIGSDSDWKSVSAGSAHTCAIKTDGSLYCWGDNIYGQLGFGNTNSTSFPTRVGSDSDWDLISTGSDYTCSTKTGSSLYCWGWNNYGQLGLGDTTNRYSPTQVGSDSDWNLISAVANTCAIKTDGSLYCWGWNDYGQLGLGDTNSNRYSPTRVEY